MRHLASPPIHVACFRASVNIVPHGPSIPGALWIVLCVTFYSHHGPHGAEGYPEGAALFSLN